jgi:hypothetical protein
MHDLLLKLLSPITLVAESVGFEFGFAGGENRVN